MKVHVRYGNLFAVLIAAATGAWPAAAWAAVNVTLDPAVRYQTIRGWGAASASPSSTSPLLREAVVREAVNELGLTRLRLELPSGNRSDTTPWEQPNDDWDPLHTNWPAFNTAAMDRRVTEMVLPFKKAVAASRGTAETGTLPVTVPSNAVLAVYAYPGTNQPPTVTDFKATPDFLTLSGPGRSAPSTASLSASATDPERDPLSYPWSLHLNDDGMVAERQ